MVLSPYRVGLLHTVLAIWPHSTGTLTLRSAIQRLNKHAPCEIRFHFLITPCSLSPYSVGRCLGLDSSPRRSACLSPSSHVRKAFTEHMIVFPSSRSFWMPVHLISICRIAVLPFFTRRRSSTLSSTGFLHVCHYKRSK